MRFETSPLSTFVSVSHPGGNPGAKVNLPQMPPRRFAWELTKEMIVLPLGCLQGGSALPGLRNESRWAEARSKGNDKNTPHVYDWPPYDGCVPFYSTSLQHKFVLRVLLFLGASSKVSFNSNTAQVVKFGLFLQPRVFLETFLLLQPTVHERHAQQLQGTEWRSCKRPEQAHLPRVRRGALLAQAFCGSMGRLGSMDDLRGGLVFKAYRRLYHLPEEREDGLPEQPEPAQTSPPRSSPYNLLVRIHFIIDRTPHASHLAVTTQHMRGHTGNRGGRLPPAWVHATHDGLARTTAAATACGRARAPRPQALAPLPPKRGGAVGRARVCAERVCAGWIPIPGTSWCKS